MLRIVISSGCDCLRKAEVIDSLIAVKDENPEGTEISNLSKYSKYVEFDGESESVFPTGLSAGSVCPP